MRVLLDTHVLLCALTDDDRLSERARDLIADPENTVHVSAACLWEIAIKHALGKGNMPVAPEPTLQWCREAGYGTLCRHRSARGRGALVARSPHRSVRPHHGRAGPLRADAPDHA